MGAIFQMGAGDRLDFVGVAIAFQTLILIERQRHSSQLAANMGLYHAVTRLPEARGRLKNMSLKKGGKFSKRFGERAETAAATAAAG